MSQLERFQSRKALILAALGMAIGTGNIWRFPRIAAQHGENGGGAFLIAWIVGLLFWSIPLLAVELALGRHTRKGTVGSFSRLLGPGKSWLGAWVGFCSLAILFYYSVVTGWCFRYLAISVVAPGQFTGREDAVQSWLCFADSSSPIIFHMLALTAAAVVVMGGVVRGIERANRLFIPLLFVLLILAAGRTVMLDGAEHGLAYLFHLTPGDFLKHRLWLDAISQSAWSTGAGWGLLLTYAVYSRNDENLLRDSVVTGIGNNGASLLAALIVIPTAFAALEPGTAREALGQPGPANTGMAFIWIPYLILQFPFGRYMLIVFFLALSLAALSSLIALVELPVRNLIDAGFSRRRALMLVWIVALVLGLPSARSLKFLENQDWVWSLGLLISGLFFIVAVNAYGSGRFWSLLAGDGSGRRVLGRWFQVLVVAIIPAEFFIMFTWWLWQSIQWSHSTWWNPFEPFSPMTCFVQWGVVLGILVLAARLVPRWLSGGLQGDRQR